MPSQQNTLLLYSLLCILVHNALPCIYIHRGYVLCCMLIQWFVNVIIILILPPMHSHRYIFLVDEYMDIYYCTLYKACIMITWQFHLSINWKKLSTCCLLYVCSLLTWRYQVSTASVQMIGSLSTNEGKENKESGMARWRQNEYLAYCLEVFFCF